MDTERPKSMSFANPLKNRLTNTLTNTLTHPLANQCTSLSRQRAVSVQLRRSA
jgi:hypothetical protein